MALKKDSSSSSSANKKSVSEDEVRQKVVDDAEKWLGTTEGSENHQKILGVYNSQSTLPRDHTAVESDEWCAEFVSAVAVETGYTGSNMIPTECSVNKMTEYFQNAGNYQTADSGYEPKEGDIVFYDWEQGKGTEGTDPVASADHVGIVKSNENGVLTVIEGNTDQNKDGVDGVETRTVELSTESGCIRGYGTPDYAAQAQKETAQLQAGESAKQLAEDQGYDVGDDGKVTEKKSLKKTLGQSNGTELQTDSDKLKEESLQEIVDASNDKQTTEEKTEEKTSSRREPNKDLLGTPSASSSDFSLVDTLRSKFF